MNYKLGDKVLVALTITRLDPDDRQKLQYAGTPDDAEAIRSIWVKESEMRPWTERPTPPVTVLWTMHGLVVGKYHVQSDGTVVSEDGDLTSEMQRTVLAAYVRHLQGER